MRTLHVPTDLLGAVPDELVPRQPSHSPWIGRAAIGGGMTTVTGLLALAMAPRELGTFAPVLGCGVLVLAVAWLGTVPRVSGGFGPALALLGAIVLGSAGAAGRTSAPSPGLVAAAIAAFAIGPLVLRRARLLKAASGAVLVCLAGVLLADTVARETWFAFLLLALSATSVAHIVELYRPFQREDDL